jgi:hypothetical protein
MTRIIRTLGLALALAAAGLCGSFAAWTAGGTAAASGSDTPLPPGWELCVLQGLSAPLTPANVTDLDAWQAAEGGSTNNSAAFNPFNTLRTTDLTGAPIPGVTSANGFPAYANWQGGCAATVATLVQPNMWVVTAALRGGDVSPAGAFLAVVDQSAWCAPSAGGLPCYASSVLGLAGNLPAVLPVSSALNVYGDVTSDLHAYQLAIAAQTADQSVLLEHDLALASTDSAVSAARGQFGAASRALQGFAVNEYVNSGLYSGAPLVSSGTTAPLTPSTPKDSDGVVAQQYLGVAAANLISRDSQAEGAVKGTEQKRDDAAKAVSQAATTLASDEASENRDLTQLVTDVAALERAGACTAVTIAAPVPAATAGASGSTTTTTTAPPTTTTTTTVPPTTTTTTTVPPTTTTTLLSPGLLPTPVSTTTTTTTVPPTTTTTTVPPTTTTTTTVPASPSTATAPAAVPPGVVALQGCVASLAPPASS